jgi:hypothetical protein
LASLLLVIAVNPSSIGTRLYYFLCFTKSEHDVFFSQNCSIGLPIHENMHNIDILNAHNYTRLKCRDY